MSLQRLALFTVAIALHQHGTSDAAEGWSQIFQSVFHSGISDVLDARSCAGVLGDDEPYLAALRRLQESVSTLGFSPEDAAKTVERIDAYAMASGASADGITATECFALLASNAERVEHSKAGAKAFGR